MGAKKPKNVLYNLESQMLESINVLMTFVTRMDYSHDITNSDLENMNKTEKCAYDVLITNFDKQGALLKINEIVDNYIRMRSSINLDIVINHVFTRENSDPITQEEYDEFADHIKQAVDIVVENTDYKTPLDAVNKILDKMLNRQSGGKTSKTSKRSKAQIANDIFAGLLGKEKTGASGKQTTSNALGSLLSPIAQAAQQGLVNITNAGTNKLSSKISGTPIVTTTTVSQPENPMPIGLKGVSRSYVATQAQPITLSPALIREEINKVSVNGTMTAAQKTVILTQLQTILGQVQNEVDRLNIIPTVGGKKKTFDIDSFSSVFSKWNEVE